MGFSWMDAERQAVALQAALSVEATDIDRARRICDALVKSVRTRAEATTEVRGKFQEKQLIQALRNLAFETWHFRCLSQVRREKQMPSWNTMRQAVGYALLVHIRVIISFFYGRATLPRDCHAYHFSRLEGFDAKFPAALCERTENIERLIEALNQFLAHFSSARWEMDRKPWTFYESFEPTIDGLITRFEAALPDHVYLEYVQKYKQWQKDNPATN
jgi:hypothetical protein